MTEAQQKVKPGDKIAIKGGGKELVVVTSTCEDGAWGYWYTAPEPQMTLWRWYRVILPEPPKAKPGVRYETSHPVAHSYRFAIGTLDGRLTFDCGITRFPLSEHWREVAE